MRSPSRILSSILIFLVSVDGYGLTFGELAELSAEKKGDSRQAEGSSGDNYQFNYANIEKQSCTKEQPKVEWVNQQQNKPDVYRGSDAYQYQYNDQWVEPYDWAYPRYRNPMSGWSSRESQRWWNERGRVR